MTASVCLEHLLCLCIIITSWKRRFQDFPTFSLVTARGEDSLKFQEDHLNDISKVGDILQLNVFLYEIGLVGPELIGELAYRSFQKYDKSLKLIQYNNRKCDVNNINEL